MSRSVITSWGPSAWTLLHTISFAYPEEPTDDAKKRAYDFLCAFAANIPCKKCRDDWEPYIHAHLQSSDSEHLKNRETFSRFMTEAHNHVNRKLKKREFTYEQVCKLYAPPEATNRKRVLVRLSILMAVIVLVIFTIRAVVIHAPKKQIA